MGWVVSPRGIFDVNLYLMCDVTPEEGSGGFRLRLIPLAFSYKNISRLYVSYLRLLDN
jgi:hypothetical protein